MLETLSIRNLATIATVDVEFTAGLNAVTGETGAGKSIIIGAVQALLGGRAEKTLIRHGAATCEVTAVLRLPSAHPLLTDMVAGVLGDAGLPPCEEGELILRRVIGQTTSRAFLNGVPAALQTVRTLGDALVDFHGPHDHQSLLRPACQLELLDSYADLTGRVDECRAAHGQLRQAEAEVARLRRDHLDPGEISVLRHQAEEIQAAELSPEEEAGLVQRHRFIGHARRLLEIASQCQAGLAEADNSVCDQLSTHVRLVEELTDLVPEAGERFLARLEEAVGTIQQVSSDLANFAAELDLDEQELARVEERLEIIHRLKRRYGPDVEAIIAQGDAARERLDAIENRTAAIARAEQFCDRQRREHAELCAALTTARNDGASGLAQAIAAKLGDLGFARSLFEIRVERAEPGPTGADRVEFCFAPNPGQDILPLRKIASSGEIARVMLAVKTVLSSADRVPVLVFDEVDANIGGRIASSVASELAQVGRRHQVLCVTHLPQIAAAALSHFQVGKEIDGDATFTHMHRLDRPGRVAEIARMMGADADSETASRHAAEMLMTAGGEGARSEQED